VGEHLVPVLEFDTEHRIRQRLDDRAFEHYRVFFQFRQFVLLRTRPGRGVLVGRFLLRSPGLLDGSATSTSSARTASAERGEETS
jgi:hypothetical protein